MNIPELLAACAQNPDLPNMETSNSWKKSELPFDPNTAGLPDVQPAGLFELNLPIGPTEPQRLPKLSLEKVINLCEQYRQWFNIDKLPRSSYSIYISLRFSNQSESKSTYNVTKAPPTKVKSARSLVVFVTPTP
jgi:hypothetical protein